MNTEQPDGNPEVGNAEVGTDPAVDQTNDASDNESYHGYSVDDETQPQGTGDSLVDDDRGLDEPLDEGYSPPEKWSAAQGFGNTPYEEAVGEALDRRVAQEVPETDPYDETEREPGPAEAGDPAVEAGAERAGRLVEPDEGVHTDTDQAPLAADVGIDGAGAGAEEAAVHVTDELPLEDEEEEVEPPPAEEHD
jgi:hypothetical protein